jgi:hypothetical protein
LRTETILSFHRLLKERREAFPRYGVFSDLDSVLLQILVGLNILLDGLFDHIRGLLAVFLNPVGIELVVALRGAFLR